MTYQEMIKTVLAHLPGIPVQMVLGDLDAYNHKSKPLKDALKLAKKAVSLAPNNGIILDTLGWILFKQGENQKALNTLKKASSLLPNNATILYHIGIVQYSSGNKSAAKENLKVMILIMRISIRKIKFKIFFILKQQ